MTSKKLSSHLLWLNSLTLLIGFGLIYFSFNYFVRDYINQVTKDSMQSNFTILDSMYDNKPIQKQKIKIQIVFLSGRIMRFIIITSKCYLLMMTRKQLEKPFILI